MFVGNPDLVSLGLVLQAAEDAIERIHIKLLALVRWDTNMAARAGNVQRSHTGCFAIEGPVGG